MGFGRYIEFDKTGEWLIQIIAHRPLKVDIEFDWWSGDLQSIGPHNRRYFLSEGAALL